MSENNCIAYLDIFARDSAQQALSDGSTLKFSIIGIWDNNGRYEEQIVNFYIDVIDSSTREPENYDGWYIEIDEVDKPAYRGSVWDATIHYSIYNAEGEYQWTSSQFISGPTNGETPPMQVYFTISECVGSNSDVGDVYIYYSGTIEIPY